MRNANEELKSLACGRHSIHPVEAMFFFIFLVNEIFIYRSGTLIPILFPIGKAKKG